MNIQELKEKSSEKLITEAEKLGIENASTLRRQEIYFAILKKLAEKGEVISSTFDEPAQRHVWRFLLKIS